MMQTCCGERIQHFGVRLFGESFRTFSANVISLVPSCTVNDGWGINRLESLLLQHHSSKQGPSAPSKCKMEHAWWECTWF